MKKHGTLLLLLAVFLLPLGLAKLVLDLNWYQGGVTNRGQLLASPFASEWLGQSGKWQLVYLMPDECDEGCAGALFNLRQIPHAVGAGQERVDALVLVAETKPSELQAEFLQGLEPKRVPEHVITQLHTLEYGVHAIYIADPLGNVMMAYPLVKGKDAVLAQGKDLLRDLKRLLKVSKIG